MVSSNREERHSRIAAFINYQKQIRRLSQHTIKALSADLHGLVDYCHNKRLSVEDLSRDNIQAYAAQLHFEGLSGASIARVLSSIRVFFNWSINNQYCTQNPAAGVKAPKSSRPLPTVLDPDQMAALLRSKSENWHSCRDLAMFELLYSSALRLSELVTLKLQDMDLENGLITVSGKGGKVRMIPLGSKAIEALKKWLPMRQLKLSQEANDRAGQAVFISQRGRAIATRTVQSRLAYWGLQHKLPQRLHPHMLRHCAASHLLESSQDLRAVQELLGHADISTTQIYTRLDFQHLAKVYDRAHPRSNRTGIDRPQKK